MDEIEIDKMGSTADFMIEGEHFTDKNIDRSNIKRLATQTGMPDIQLEFIDDSAQEQVKTKITR